MRRFLYPLLIVALSLVAGCAGSRRDDPGVVTRAQRVQAALTDMAAALQQYHEDHGFFPKGLATLREANYLVILPDLEREWTISYYTDGDRVTMIQALSTGNMVDGADFSITYRVLENAWEGYGFTVWP